jgi:hypothetical protein
MNKKKPETTFFAIVISGILIVSSLLSISSSQLIQEVRAQNITNQATTNATANQTNMDNAATTTITTTPSSSSCCPSNQYIANAGPDQTVLEGTIITLNGSSSNNNNNNNSISNVGNTANYLWRQTNGPAIILNGNNTAHPSFVAPNYPNDTKYTFALEVFGNQVNNNNNNQPGSAIDTVDIIVKDANIEAKKPGFVQEEDDDTGNQSDQNELDDEEEEAGEGGEEEQSDDDNTNNEEEGNVDE